jgi:hypothetical protein
MIEQTRRRAGIREIELKAVSVTADLSEFSQKRLRLSRIGWQSRQLIVGPIVSDEEIRAVACQFPGDRRADSSFAADARDERQPPLRRPHRFAAELFCAKRVRLAEDYWSADGLRL